MRNLTLSSLSEESSCSSSELNGYIAASMDVPIGQSFRIKGGEGGERGGGTVGVETQNSELQESGYVETVWEGRREKGEEKEEGEEEVNHPLFDCWEDYITYAIDNSLAFYISFVFSFISLCFCAFLHSSSVLFSYPLFPFLTPKVTMEGLSLLPQGRSILRLGKQTQNLGEIVYIFLARKFNECFSTFSFLKQWRNSGRLIQRKLPRGNLLSRNW